MIAIITLILNLLLGAPAEKQTATTSSTTTTTMSADSEEQAVDSMGGSGAWGNSTKD